MSKTKAQLRAEAVERLKNSVGARFKPDAAIIAIVGGRIGQVDWSIECEKLIDLLSDDEQPDTFHDDFYDCESTVDAGEDSREKLEADIEEYLACEYGCIPGIVAVYPDWLDRQAAITEQECKKRTETVYGWVREHEKANGVLRDKVDELERAYDELTAKCAELCALCGFSMVDANGEVIS